MANRLWAHYFGRGLVDPPDGLAAANPASHPVLLDELARRFVASNYDLKAAHRILLNSIAYQRSSKPNDSNRADRRSLLRAGAATTAASLFPWRALAAIPDQFDGSKFQLAAPEPNPKRGGTLRYGITMRMPPPPTSRPRSQRLPC